MEPDPFGGTTGTGFLCGGTDIPTSRFHQTTKIRCWGDDCAAVENVHALAQAQRRITHHVSSAQAEVAHENWLPDRRGRILRPIADRPVLRQTQARPSLPSAQCQFPVSSPS